MFVVFVRSSRDLRAAAIVEMVVGCSLCTE